MPTSASSRNTSRGCSPVELGLRLLVAELLPTADPGPDHVGVDHLPVRIQPDRPQQGGPDLIRQQTRRPLAEHRRVERDPSVRGVHRHPPPVRFVIKQIPARDEGGHIGDRVGDDEAVVGPPDVQRLIEITRAGRIDRDQLQVGPIMINESRPGRGAVGRGQHIRRELRGNGQALADGGQASGQVVGHISGQPDLTSRHDRTAYDGVRMRIRPHSSQRMTSSAGAAAITRRSAALTINWQPVQRPWRSSAAPTPPWDAASLSYSAIRFGRDVRGQPGALVAGVGHLGVQQRHFGVAPGGDLVDGALHGSGLRAQVVPIGHRGLQLLHHLELGVLQGADPLLQVLDLLDHGIQGLGIGHRTVGDPALIPREPLADRLQIRLGPGLIGLQVAHRGLGGHLRRTQPGRVDPQPFQFGVHGQRAPPMGQLRDCRVDFLQSEQAELHRGVCLNDRLPPPIRRLPNRILSTSPRQGREFHRSRAG